MPVSVVFVLFLIIVLITAFFILLPQARNNVAVLPEQTTTEPPELQTQTPEAQAPQVQIPDAQAPEEQTPPDSPQDIQEETLLPDDSPQETVQEPQDIQQEPPAAPPAEEIIQTVDRGIYFMQATWEGDLVLARVNRRLETSNTPLLDSLNVLLAGTTAEERNRGLMNFIPPGTRIISTEMRGTTAVINFNDEFQFGTDGREGYDAQIEQITATAKEFSSVQNVEIRVRGIQVDVYSHGH